MSIKRVVKIALGIIVVLVISAAYAVYILKWRDLS